MRSLPLLLALLLCAIGLTLAVSVMLEQAPATSGEEDAGGAPGDGLPQGHVYAGVTSEPDDVNPFTSHGNVARRFVLGLTHEGLVDTDPATGELRGALAESFELAPDGLSCTFTLREGVRFSDGEPVTMADVLFGWELQQAGHVQFGFVGDAFARVSAVEALDGRRLRVTFREPYYAAVRAVGERWLVARRAFFVDRVAAMSQRLGVPVPTVDSSEFAALLAQIDRECGPGTGPFRLPSDDDGPRSWRRRQDLTLTRNPHHWRREAVGGSWNLAGVRLLFREGSAIWNALLAGEIDWLGAWTVDAMLEQRPELSERYRKLVYDYETLGVIGVIWNCRKPALADVRVRRALAMLMQRDAIVERYGDAVVPAMAFAKPTSASYPKKSGALGYEPAEARRLLREAGFDAAEGRPLRLSLLAVRDGGPMDLAVDLLAHAARDAGVEIAVDTLTFPAYVARKKRGDWDGLLVNRSFRPWADPYDFVHSEGVDNDGHFSHPEVDRLAAAARAELDADERAALWRELHELVYREQPFAFLVHPRSCILFNRHIEAAEPGPRGLWPERWWVAPENQRR